MFTLELSENGYLGSESSEGEIKINEFLIHIHYESTVAI